MMHRSPHITPGRSPALMLASVASHEEAMLALEGGADVIDIKDATQGSLGAASLEASRHIVASITSLASHTPISATVGDLPMSPEVLSAAYRERAALGVHYVKLGLQPSPARADCVTAIQIATESTPAVQAVAVLFADLELPTNDLIAQLAAARFAGIVIDTFHKQGALLTHIDTHHLKQLIRAAHEHHLFIGLAGSLTLSHVTLLAPLQPDMLGFRGALCNQNMRSQTLQLTRVRALREAMDASSAVLA